MAFTHTLRCAMLRCAGKNAFLCFTSAAQRRAAWRMSECWRQQRTATYRNAERSNGRRMCERPFRLTRCAMLPITFLLSESARLRVCFALMALTFLGVGLSTLYLLVVRALSSSLGYFTALVERYDADQLTTQLTYLAAVSVLLNALGLAIHESSGLNETFPCCKPFKRMFGQ